MAQFCKPLKTWHQMISIKSNLLFLYCLIFFSCKSKPQFSFSEININIKYSSLYEYDLQNEFYTVYFLSKPPYKVKFSLTEIEKKQIVNDYYLYKINEIDTACVFDDECHIMPKLFTSLNIKSPYHLQKIEIDMSCNNFSFFKKDKAKKVRKFILSIQKILMSKSEIKNGPKSDIVSL